MDENIYLVQSKKGIRVSLCSIEEENLVKVAKTMTRILGRWGKVALNKNSFSVVQTPTTDFWPWIWHKGTSEQWHAGPINKHLESAPCFSKFALSYAQTMIIMRVAWWRGHGLLNLAWVSASRLKTILALEALNTTKRSLNNLIKKPATCQKR